MSSQFDIDLTHDQEHPLPPDVINDWLPIRNKSVFHLLGFTKYPSNKTNYAIPLVFAPVLHEEVTMDFDYNSLLQLGPPVDSSVTKAYQAAIKLAIHSVTPIPHFGNPITLSAWIFNYWGEIKSAALYREQWKAALVWLRSHSESPVTAGHCQEVLIAPSFFPWSGNNASVEDITSLLSQSPIQSYLSNFHINHMIGQISNQYKDLRGPEASRRHIITTVDILGAITTFYGSRRTPTKTGNILWERLMEIENHIIEGRIDSVSGVHYLPLHWVSVVFNIQEWSILYGDSLGQPLPKLERYAFTQWIRHLKFRSGQETGDDHAPIHPLPTGHQDNSTSCGLFALNAICHHDLSDPLLSPDQMSLVCNQMEIALDLLHSNTV